ncbi:MAG: hypothetical protein U0931_22090 [Vulcanimicrobiota bacterium]
MRRRRGFVLMAALMLSVVLVLATFLLHQQQRLLANRSLRFERQYATSDQAYGDFLHSLALDQLGGLKIPSRGYSVPVPSQDLNAQAGDLRHSFRGLASTAFPLGLLAGQGDLTIRSVRSVHDYDNGPQDERLMGLMCQVGAGGNLLVHGHLNGHAYARGGKCQSNDGSGILHNQWSDSLQLPTEFEDGLSTLRNELQATPGLLKLPPSCPQSVRLPPDQSQAVEGGLEVGQNLLIGDNSVLLVRGDLKVTGSVYLGRHSSLMVQGAASCGGLNLSYSWHRQGLNLASICSCLYSRGPLQIVGQGMGCAEVTGWAPSDPTMPENLGVCQAEAPDTTDVAGALLVSDCELRVQGGKKVSGLLYARGIKLDGVEQLLGVAWSTQDLQAADTDYRYFPFYTHAFAHTSVSNVTVSASRSHATAWGQVR